MEVYVKGLGKTVLTRRHFVAQGGEGAVYARDGTAYKIYARPERAVPSVKIGELAALAPLDFVIRPERVVLDPGHTPIGFTMRYLKREHTFLLCRLFNKAFRDRYGIGSGTVAELVRRFQEGVRLVHRQGILLVDLNEMNFLLDDAFRNIYFIDVAGYQTPGFAATAIADSVRDRHAQGFSELTDWFSWGVVTFQLFTGIHPYRGKHPQLKTLDERMQHNVSVLNGAVSVPGVCQDFSVIPGDYLDWYRALFEDGLRTPPPSAGAIDPGATRRPAADPSTAMPPRVGGLSSGKRFRMSELFDFGEDIVSHLAEDGVELVVTSGGVWYNRRRIADRRAGSVVGLSPRMNRPFALRIEDGTARVTDLLQGEDLDFAMNCDQIMTCRGRFYAKNGEQVVEIQLLELGTTVAACPVPACSVLERATALFEGAIVQDVLGSWCFSFPVEPGKCRQVTVDELRGRRIVDAGFDSGVAVMIAVRDGRYSRFVMRIDARSGRYDLRETADITELAVNFTVLENGVAVLVAGGGEVEVFRARVGDGGRQEIFDPAVMSGMRLFRSGTSVVFALGSTLQGLTMRG